MKPQGPLGDLFKKLEGAKTLDPNSYVNNLTQSLKQIHKEVGVVLCGEYEKLQNKREKEMSKERNVEVGDHVFLRQPPANIKLKLDDAVEEKEKVSLRLLPRADMRIFRVMKKPSPMTAVLADPDTGNTEFEFPQPVHISRLIAYDLCEMESPIDEKKPLRMELLVRGTWVPGQVISQSTTGAVRLKLNNEKDTRFVDLHNEEYRWLYI